MSTTVPRQDDKIVNCKYCRYSHREVLIDGKTSEIVEIWYHCKAFDIYMSETEAEDDLPCTDYDEELDDYKTA